MYCFAVNGRQFFIGPIIELFKEAGFISMRSISSKLVKPDELVGFFLFENLKLNFTLQGKINSLIGIAEGLMPLIFAPMYTQLYRATIEVLPGAFYLLGGAFTLPLVAIFL
jgi:PCFT/HCP family folate transporter-like MFS transporter 1/3